MKTLLTIFLLFVCGISYSQDVFRRDYNHVTFYEDGKWGEWKDTSVSVVFNINNNGDIRLYYPSGEEVVFRSISRVIKDKTSDGREYQAVKVLSDKGYECYIQVFDDFMKIMYSKNFMIQLNE